jgi:C_GCAxxG_C_C family probable redox protein
MAYSMSPDEAVQKAKQHFYGGYSCAESVLMTLLEVFEIEGENLRHAAAGFGGGIGRSQDVCGALSGEVIGLGFQLGRSMPVQAELREKSQGVVKEMYRSFATECGAVDCAALTETDFSDATAYDAWRKGTGKDDICMPCVDFAVRKAMELGAR